ncbi:prevent-host-death protein [Armatimonas sp.]|uniref:prevent-host-death protein n=1 Tax=Armatimonas sp. TaxID=1872638 RepID=UPI0037509A66
MAVLEITEEQIIKVLEQLLPEQRERILHRFTGDGFEPVSYLKRPVFGSGKKEIISITDDFDAPLEDFTEYM